MFYPYSNRQDHQLATSIIFCEKLGQKFCKPFVLAPRPVGPFQIFSPLLKPLGHEVVSVLHCLVIQALNEFK